MIKRLAELGRAWVALWDRREAPTALAMVRIGIALVLLYDYLDLWQLGIVEAMYARPPDGYATGYTRGLWSVDWLGAGPDAAFALWLASIVSLVMVVIGALTRVACIVAVLISAQFAFLAPDADRGIDGLLRLVLLIVALSRSHAIWSVDAWVWKKLGRPPPAEVPAWPRYLLFLQLLWVYFSGGHNKTGLEWGPQGGFTALANALSDPHFARFDPGWVGPIYPLTRLATAATMAFELGAPLMIVFTYFAATRDRPGRIRRWCNKLRLRWIWIALGLSFHVGIAITLRLGIFPLGMLAMYPVLFFPDEIARFVTWVRSRVTRR
jgi:uncharacterized membrane protein YphA (DoxX/SURF4 family)